MPKLETIKKQEKIIITGTIPVEVANLTKAKALIFNATKTKNHNDLTIPTIYFAELTKKYAEADKALKQKIKEAIEKSKEIKETIIILKKEIKDAALKIVKPEQKPAKNKEGEIKTNELGEVVFNTTHNLNTQIFSFSPKSKSITLNSEALIKEFKKDEIAATKKYGGIVLVKKETIFSIDVEALNKYKLTSPKNELPYEAVEKDASISIKEKSILKHTKDLIEDLDKEL